MMTLVLGVITYSCMLSPPYQEFNGIEYAVCDDFYHGRVFIKNVNKLSVNEIVEFAFCYTTQNNFEGLAIESQYYPAPSIWTGEKNGNTLFKIQFDYIDYSESEKEVVLRKETVMVKKFNGTKFINIDDSNYKRTYDCKDTL